MIYDDNIDHYRYIGGKDGNIQYDIIRELGTGVFGTAYLINYNGELRVLKRTQIIKRNKKEDRFYSWIDTLPPRHIRFFCRRYNAEITTCPSDFKQIPPFDLVNIGKKRLEFIMKHRESTICLEEIIEYKGMVLNKFLISKYFRKSPQKRVIIYDILQQLAYAAKIMYDAGHYHRDLHPANICIKTTKMGRNETRQISIIDYGEVDNKQCGTLKLRQAHCFLDFVFAVRKIISNTEYSVVKARKIGDGKLPFERKRSGDDIKFIDKIMQHDPEFYAEMIERFPEAAGRFNRDAPMKIRIPIDFAETLVSMIFQSRHPGKFWEYRNWPGIATRCLLPASEIELISNTIYSKNWNKIIDVLTL